MEWSLLAGLAPADRDIIVAAARRRRYAKGEVVWHEGDLGDTLHFVRSGRLAVRMTTEGGERATLTIVAPGDAVGELALVGPRHRRTASLVALEAVETSCLSRGDFAALRSTHPSVDAMLVGLLAARVERLSHQLLESRFSSAGRRVAGQLMTLAEVYADGAPGAHTVIPLTQDDIAEMVGLTRPTLNQVLQTLVDAGAIVLGRGRVEIIDLVVLRRRAGR